METINRIYEVLQENLSYPQEVWLEDLVDHGCGYRHHYALKGVEAKEPERPQDIIIRETSRNIRHMVRRYLEGAYKERFRSGMAFHINGTIIVDFIGMLDDALVEVVPVSTEVFAKGSPPKSARITTVAKAHLMGAKKAWLILIDRNSQDWSSWSIEGDFALTGDVVLREARYVQALLDGSGKVMGTASKQTCSRCPYQNTCDMEPVGDPDPFPEKLQYALDPALITEIDKYLWTLNDEDVEIKERISPSHFSITPCDRAVAYGLLATKQKPRIEPKLRRIFDVGHAVHDVLQAAMFWAYPEDFEEEVKMHMPQYRMKGSCDGVRRPVAKGFEFKSISVKGFAKLSSAKSDHVKQATMYRKGLELKIMEYIYACKEDGDLRSFEPRLDNKTWHKLADRAERIIKAVDAHRAGEGDLPPKIEGKDYECRKCRYGWTCRPELFRRKKQAAARRRFTRR